MGNYSKLIGAIVGGAISYGVNKGILPAEWTDPTTVSAVTTVVISICVYLFPANKA